MSRKLKVVIILNVNKETRIRILQDSKPKDLTYSEMKILISGNLYFLGDNYLH